MSDAARTLSHGPWSLLLTDGGALRTIRYRGVEVVRGIDCPIRDGNWGTWPQERAAESFDEAEGVYTRSFTAAQGAVAGTLTVALGRGGRLWASLKLCVWRDFSTNRAGFVVLHPIAGVAGEPLTVTHPDGSVEDTRFPTRIAPSQPAVDIAGLSHERDGIGIALSFSGDVFEMEDQRNWADASFKTYCRPLSLPFPYTLNVGETVRQELSLKCSGNPSPARAASHSPKEKGHAPEVLLAVERGWEGAADGFPGVARLARLGADETGVEPWLSALSGTELDLEVVIPEGAAPRAHLRRVAENLAARGLSPRHVIALPEAYLKSYQPEGSWPSGPTPTDAASAAREAFPAAKIGVGMLTNFTELNRCPPEPGVGDYLTFSTTAIVHAADDLSVRETLETLPQLFESARALAPGLPIRLGLVSIGMRTNPYGASVAPNPAGSLKPMVRDDPRQQTGFAAAYAAAALEAARNAGVEALALAAPAGPFAAGAALLEFLEEVRR